jgi:hypothetical protein
MEDSGQLHVQGTLPLRKELPVPIGKEVGWAPDPFWKLSKSFIPAGNRNTIPRTSRFSTELI